IYTGYDVAAEAARAAAAAATAPRPTGRAANRQARRQAARQARRSGEAVLVMASAMPLVLAAPAAYVLGRLLVG
ncbi:MAG TPA: hypothetical protein VNC22_11440, partial [Sporichthya sp.]|nr:hypothetical protein [Sporichthya sp.]